MWAPRQQGCRPPTGRNQQELPRQHPPARLAANPALEWEARCCGAQRQAPSVQQQEPDAGGSRAWPAPHHCWRPLRSHDREPKQAAWSPCHHRPRSDPLAFYFQYFTLSAGQPDRSGHQAVTGEAVGEHHLPQFPHLENRPNTLPSWIKREDEMTGLQHSVVINIK